MTHLTALLARLLSAVGEALAPAAAPIPVRARDAQPQGPEARHRNP